MGWFGRGRYERAGFQLYTASVQAARHPYFYAELDVPDTLDGRFDLVGLYVCMLIQRLRALPPKGPALAQAVFDAMFADMDTNLRELGVGDMTIAKKVKAMWEAFHGRAVAYDAPLAAYDEAALAEALARNVWRGSDAPAAAALARIAVAQMRALDAAAPEPLMAGQVHYLAPAPLVAA